MDEAEKQAKIQQLRGMLGELTGTPPRVKEHFPELASNVARVIETRKWSLRQAARNTGISHTKIGEMQDGNKTGYDLLKKWASAIGEPVSDWLIWGGFDEIKQQPLNIDDPLSMIGRDVNVDALANVPMIGAGVPAAPTRVRDGEGEDYELESVGVRLPTGVRTMEVVGDCMEPLLHDGDIVYVRPATHANSGDIVIALVDMSGITCKVYRKDEAGRSYLEPYLRAGGYSETGARPKPGEGRIPSERFSIAGVVVGYYRPIGAGL